MLHILCFVARPGSDKCPSEHMMDSPLQLARITEHATRRPRASTHEPRRKAGPEASTQDPIASPGSGAIRTP